MICKGFGMRKTWSENLFLDRKWKLPYSVICGHRTLM